MSSMEQQSVRLTQEHKDAFKEFIKSLPRTCSPTVCGTIRYNSEADYPEDSQTQEFNWSIDQIAILQPNEISLDEQFNGELTNLSDLSLDKENENFFNQLEILPSPAHVKMTPGDNQEAFLTPFSRVGPGNQSTPYQPFTSPPPTRSTSRSARLSAVSSITPYNYKTKNKKKLFKD